MCIVYLWIDSTVFDEAKVIETVTKNSFYNLFSLKKDLSIRQPKKEEKCACNKSNNKKTTSEARVK